VLILQRVRELVGGRHALEWPERAGAGDDVELLRLGVVLAEHEPATKLQQQPPQVGAAVEEAERHQQLAVGG